MSEIPDPNETVPAAIGKRDVITAARTIQATGESPITSPEAKSHDESDNERYGRSKAERYAIQAAFIEAALGDEFVEKDGTVVLKDLHDDEVVIKKNSYHIDGQKFDNVVLKANGVTQLHENIKAAFLNAGDALMQEDKWQGIDRRYSSITSQPTDENGFKPDVDLIDVLVTGSNTIFSFASDYIGLMEHLLDESDVPSYQYRSIVLANVDMVTKLTALNLAHLRSFGDSQDPRSRVWGNFTNLEAHLEPDDVRGQKLVVDVPLPAKPEPSALMGRTLSCPASLQVDPDGKGEDTIVYKAVPAIVNAAFDRGLFGKFALAPEPDEVISGTPYDDLL